MSIALTPAYRFPVGQPIEYRAVMRFEGFLPILGIGEGKAEVNGTFRVVGKTATTAEAGLTSFEVSFNGGKIPIDIDDARKYVPGGQFAYTPGGAVSGWDPPTSVVAIRVPGLDLHHLPEALFLPVAFPLEGIQEGRAFTFSLPLSGGIADYTVTPGVATADNVPITLKVHQTYKDFEDDSQQIVSEKDAAAKVATDVVGTGTGTFDQKLGRFTKFVIDDVATGTATDLQTKKVTFRRLSRHLEIVS